MMRHRRLRSVAMLMCAVALASCSHSSGDSGSETSGTGSTSAHDVLVTIGSSATYGDGLDNPLRDAWPQVLFHESFAQSTVLINASQRAVTVERALAQQLSLAIEQHATVVAVWLGDLDLESGVDPATFEGQLDTLVEQLTASGARVLLGNISRSEPGAAAYDDAITRVAHGPSAAGVTLVDVAAALSATPEIGPSSDVDASMSVKVAHAFGSALAQA